MAIWNERLTAAGTHPSIGRVPALASRIARRLAPGALFISLLALGWHVMALRWQSPLIPDVGEIGHELSVIVTSGDAATQIGTTLGRLVLGMLLAFAIAFPVGFLSARNQFARAFFEPALLLGLTVPGLVWALLCVIWFGLSLQTSVVAIALGISPALAVSIAQGIESVDPQLVETAHIYRFRWPARIRYLWLPAILPFLMSGMRLAFSLAWKVVVLVEVFGLSTGVGYALNSAFISQNVGAVIAWTLIFAVVVAVIEYGLFQVVERRLTRWRKKASV